jgi:hypothetical protein
VLQPTSEHTEATEPPRASPFLQLNCAECDLKGAAERHSLSKRTRFGASPLKEDKKLGTVVCHQKYEDSEFVSWVNSATAHINSYYRVTSLKSSDITAYKYCRPLTTSGRRLESCDPLSGAFQKKKKNLPSANELNKPAARNPIWKDILIRKTNKSNKQVNA